LELGANARGARAFARRPAEVLRNENGFAERAGFQNFLVGTRGLGEGHLFPDDRTLRAILQAGEKAGVNFLFFGFDG
jgi:hypothetical protein